MSLAGIIPTRVGTSSLRITAMCLMKDHPHACGDKPCTDLKKASAKGSSPRVWGQVPLRRLRSDHHRIIPTRVGTSTFVPLLSISVEDHPHACGDKTVTERRETLSGGSSPRVWGQACNRHKLERNRRIIPTRVGTSFHIL